MRTITPVINATALVGLLFMTALGQAPNPQPGGPTNRSESVGKSTENRTRVIAARQMMENGGYEPAAAMLELVYEQEPGNQLVVGLLKTCYFRLKQYLKAEALIRRMIAQVPDQFGFRIELAEVLADQGLTDSARSAYRQALIGVPPADSLRFLLVIRSEVGRGYDDDALELIDSLRKQLKDSMPFTLERGAILEKQQDYGQAVDEYLKLLAQDTTPPALEAERRLIALLGFAESAGAVEARLAKETGAVRSRRVLQLLEDFTLKEGRFNQAFAYAVRLDSAEQSHGTALLYYMRRCAERKQYPEVARMGQYALAQYRSSLVSQPLMMIYANALAELEDFRGAIAQYDIVKTTSPRAQDKGEAIFAQAALYKDKLHDYVAAMALFDTLLSQYRFGNLFLNSLRDRARCFLRMGNLDSAQAAYQTAGAQTIVADISEEAVYYRGLISLFRGQYDSCKTLMQKTMVGFPMGFYVNDALQVMMVLEEAGSSPDLLGTYANALQYSERLMWDSSRLWFDRLTQGEDHALADNALYQIIGINIVMTDTTGALESIDRLASDYKDSYFTPYGLKVKADILLSGRGTPQQAKDIYLQLLEKFPNYPFASEVRKRLRQLESDAKIG